MALMVRKIDDKDYEPFKRLFEEEYTRYLKFLKLNNPQQFRKEKREKREVTRGRFNFYLKTGTSFVAEEKGNVIGYVASQEVSYMHGAEKLLWIEYIVVKPEFRRRGVGTALLQRLIEYAKRGSIDHIYATINPDNEASIRLHQKMDFNVKSWKVASLKITH